MLSVNVTDITMLIAFWIGFSRWIAILIQLPLFEEVAIPIHVKILTALMLNYAFFPITQAELMKDVLYTGVDHFWILTMANVVIGLIIGYFVKCLMDIFVSAGEIITQQIGFAQVRYYDPTQGGQIGPFEKLIKYSMLIIVINSGALIPIFKGIVHSFHSLHVYNMGKLLTSHLFFLEMFKSIFSISLMLSGPFIFTNMLIQLVLGIIARTIPQMNVMVVSFVLNIGLGLLVFFTSSEEFFQVGYRIYAEKLVDVFKYLM